MNQGLVKRERERQRALEEERREKEKEPKKTIQSLGNAWQSQMIMNQSKSSRSEKRIDFLDVKNCKTCLNAEFKGLEAYKKHIRSEWHKHNLSLKIKQFPVLTFEEFQEEQLMADFIK